MKFMKTFLLLWFFSNTIQATEIITISKVQLYNLGIKLGKLQTSKQVPLLNAPAKIVIPPAQQYIVSASQAGLISKLNKSIGDKVTKGEILAYINSPELLSLQQQFLSANNQRQLAWANYQRDKKMFNEGIIANRRWQETRAIYHSEASKVSETQQLLEIVGMSAKDIKKLKNTRKLSSRLNLYAPITGVVLERMVSSGERINILAPIYRIANLDTLWLEINIPQQRINTINLGDKVIIDHSTATAKVSLLGQSINPSNQTVLVRAIIDKTTTDIRAGQSVNTRIIQTSNQPIFKVPNSAIANSEGTAYIFIRTATGFLVKTIEVLGKQDKFSIITGTLQENMEIAIRGAVALKANWMGLGGNE